MKPCNNLICDWFSLGGNKWNCKGVPYLVKTTEECKDFKPHAPEKEKVEEEKIVKPIVTNPLQFMEIS